MRLRHAGAEGLWAGIVATHVPATLPGPEGAGYLWGIKARI
jgi:hypothetical protein